MGLFDKLKNVFVEDDFEDDLPVEEEKVVEPKIEKVEVHEELPIETFSEREVDSKEKFKFPIIFEDEDFKEEPKKNSINVLERENTKYEPEREIRKEKKVFKPSPVISPVYGVLDKNYSKEDINTKDGLLNDPENVDIDYVIKKASGEYKVKEVKKVEAPEEEPAIDLFKELKTDEFTTKEIEIPETTEEQVIETQSEVDEKIKSIDELLKDTTDEDFYSLVDSMYKDDVEEESE